MKTHASACALAAALFCTPAWALDKIYSPYVDKGELELEYSASRTFDGDSAKNNDQGHEIDAGYGITDFWALELAAGFDKEPGGHTTFEEWEIENRFQFTEAGEYWLDAGLLLAYIHPTHRNAADALEAKLLLAKDTGRFSHIANIGLEQEVGSHSSGGPGRSVVWNSRYRYNAYFEPGIEIQSDFGKANDDLDFDEQEHYAGPAIFGQIMPGLKYQAAYLFGVSDAASNGAARVLLEYETHF